LPEGKTQLPWGLKAREDGGSTRSSHMGISAGNMEIRPDWTKDWTGFNLPEDEDVRVLFGLCVLDHSYP